MQSTRRHLTRTLGGSAVAGRRFKGHGNAKIALDKGLDLFEGEGRFFSFLLLLLLFYFFLTIHAACEPSHLLGGLGKEQSGGEELAVKGDALEMCALVHRGTIDRGTLGLVMWGAKSTRHKGMLLRKRSRGFENGRRSGDQISNTTYASLHSCPRGDNIQSSPS